MYWFFGSSGQRLQHYIIAILKKGNNSFFNFKLKSTSIPLCKPFLKNQIIEKPADCIFNFFEIFGITIKQNSFLYA